MISTDHSVTHSIALKSFKIFGNVPKKGFANISLGFITGTVLSFLSLCALAGSIIWNKFLLFLPIFFIIYLVLNIKFYLYLKKHFSFKTAFLSIGIMFIDHLTCFLGVVSAAVYSILSILKKIKL